MPDRTLSSRGPIATLLAEDHADLDALLERAVPAPGAVDLASYGEFRVRLLRHIAIEEKILFPAIRAASMENFQPVRGLSGASILGDGAVCLMLDSAALVELASEKAQSTTGR